MTGIKMSMLNVFRYRKRSIITASAIAVGVMFSIMMEGLIIGANDETVRNLRDYETGEGRIYASGYFKDRILLPFDLFIEKDSRTAIETAAKNMAIAPRTVLSSELYFNEDYFLVAGSLQTALTAIDPEKDARVFRTASMISAGRWLKAGDTGVVIGSWLAEDIGAKTGYVITIECRGRGGFYQTFDAEILGIVKTDDPVVNRSSVFIDLGYADTLLALDGAVTEYTFRSAESGTKLEKLGTKIVAGTGTEFYNWQKVAEEVLKLLNGKQSNSGLFLFFIFVIAAVGITNTMLMAVMERRNEIGMLRALGYGKFSIRALFLMEGFGIGLIGTLEGLVLGCSVNMYMVAFGIDFSWLFRDLDVGYRTTGILRSAWNLSSILQTSIGALVISTIVAWFPSGKILKSEVADILRK